MREISRDEDNIVLKREVTVSHHPHTTFPGIHVSHQPCLLIDSLCQVEGKQIWGMQSVGNNAFQLSN